MQAFLKGMGVGILIVSMWMLSVILGASLAKGEVRLTPLQTPAVSELICPMTMVSNHTRRTWDSTDQVVYENMGHYCRKMGWGYYGRWLERHDNHRYRYGCGPKTDCVKEL